MKLRLLVVSLVIGVHQFFAAQANILEPVRKQNLSAFVWEDEEWPNEPFADFLDRSMKYQSELQPFKKRKAAWNVLERYYKRNKKSLNQVIGNDKTTWQNLQLLAGQQDDLMLYVAQSVNRTKTELGSVFLHAWIAQPTDNIQELEKRQSCVKYLVDHPDLFDKLEAYFEQFQSSENLLLSFWFNDPFKQASSRNYFTFSKFPTLEKYCNESSALLTASSFLAHKTRFLTSFMAGCAAAMLPVYGGARLFADVQNNKLDRLISSGGPVFGWASCIENNIVQSAVCIASGIYCGFQFQDQFQWAQDNLTLSIYLQKKLCHVARAVKAITSIGEILRAAQDCPLHDEIDIHEMIQDFMKEDSTSEKLMNMLESNTFAQEPSAMANWGEILVAYRLMHDHSFDLEDLLCAFGQIDAYMSIARLYKEHEAKNVHFTFPCYVQDSNVPMICFDKLWNPLINADIVVPNSIDLGGDSHFYNYILTGPNEGGKSTFVKSVAIGVVLGQSIGIVPASSASMTPFSYVTTYLNITDQYGKSLFEAQVERIKHILDHIDGMQNNQFSFVIIDELFNGTDARVGQAASYSIADYLSNKQQVISIFPTHFPELIGLQAQGKSVNYKVSATLDEHGNISYPFIVSPGACTQNIVLDIMKNEKFNSAIIAQAADRLKLKK